MSIIQISKIQQRSGDLVDLPQLDQAELGFASDARRLFIGKTQGNIENVEVLTAYSPVAFSQLDGAVGNLDISSDVGNGEVLTYDGNNWVNRGGNTGGYINLGQVANLAVLGGGSGYQLITDGYGNLNWEPKGFVTLHILNITKSATAVLDLTYDFPVTSGAEITINNIQGVTGFNTLNAQVKYLKPIAGTSSQYEIYDDQALTTPLDTSGYTGTYPFTTATQTDAVGNLVTVADSSIFASTNPVMFQGTLTGSGLAANTQYYVYGTPPDSTHIVVATSSDGNSANVVNLSDASITANVYVSSGIASIAIGSSGTAAGGANSQVQFNSGSVLAGDSGLVYDVSTKTMTANNVNATGNVSFGTTSIGTRATIKAALNNYTSGALALVSATSGTTYITNSGGTLAISNNGSTDQLVMTASGNVGIGISSPAYTLDVNGNANISGTLYAPNISLNGVIRANLTNAGMEIGNPGAVNTPYIDFHSSGNSSRDYDVRLIANGGGASDGLGTLTLYGILQTNSITTGASGTAGTITGNWTLTSGSQLQATYADLAEYYAADNTYASGTVLEFGGDEEVTLAGAESNKLAGVVSENPAYVLNSNIQANFPVIIALIGRTPVQVIGTVNKGDMLVSAGNGYAKASSDPKLGTVIGKAIVNKTSEEPGLVEVMVGRL